MFRRKVLPPGLHRATCGNEPITTFWWRAGGSDIRPVTTVVGQSNYRATGLGRAMD